jgi:hypothetical protein
MATAEELARFHVETAIKLTSKAYVESLLVCPSATKASPVPTPTPIPVPAAAGHRGRKPGAAPDAERCEWTLVAGDRCKNRRLEAGSFCKIHAGKIHLIDPSSTPTSTD